MTVPDGPTTGDSDALVAERYRLGTLIGRGGTASVYRAQDERLGRDVALKLFAPLLEGPDGLARHENEMRLLATFNHPSLVTLFDAGTDRRDPEHPRTFLAMELIHGTDLHARLRGGPLAAQDVAHIGADLASALEYVHGRGIIHRDIKPANVLLADAPLGSPVRPKLTDFGIARIVEGTRLTATGTMVGTAAYLSPEQATGSALGPASDIYSLGLLLLECLTGTLEYPGTSVESAVARLHRPPRVPEALGKRWVDLLTAMTSARPSDRPGALEVEQSLRGAIASGVPLALPVGAQGTTRPLPRKPDRPPRTARATTHTRVQPAATVSESEGDSTVVVPVVRNRRQWRGKPLSRPRRSAWAAATALLTTALVIIGVSAYQPPAPAAPAPPVLATYTPTPTPSSPTATPSPSVEPSTPVAPVAPAAHVPVAPAPAPGHHKGNGKGGGG
ncbi:serine/threonine-protein kinase [Arthrobacter bambusae]|uniref:serine/threonine-protein kinase n=1 Tax=Arthrobacter bambusae TaxID=1338426 RepID=UPI00277E72A2|nr:serine/threonine-protein kinase [Arthrobacter bambusae]MDQ0028392.1 serine/threonine protein kinase [Arthrobacter bambusae]MDQ0096813.1 serine/threonine protein kinase [Arthrobacter bambusae]